MKEQSNANDAIRNTNIDLIQQVTTVRDEANYIGDIQVVYDKLDRLSLDVAILMWPTRES